MEPIYIVALISFALGAMGYMVVQFWFRPIWRYRKIKRRITSDLKRYAESQNVEKNRGANRPADGKAAAIRRRGMELADCFNYDLPHWYKLLLESRRESPLDASEHLLVLANIRNVEDMGKRLEKAKNSLNIS